MKAYVIVNEGSGSVRWESNAQAAEEIEGLFRDAGAEADVHVVAGEDIGEQLKRAQESSAEVIVIGGGDGTITRSAAELLDSDKPMGVLPMGTFNLLARDLQMPLDLEESVAALVRGRVGRIDAGRINDRVFLTHANVGQLTDFTQKREELRETSISQKLVDLPRYFYHGIVDEPRYAFTILTGHEQKKVVTRTLAVVVDGYEHFDPYPRRERLDGGFLAVYVSRHETGVSMLADAIRILVTQEDTSENLERIDTDRAVVTGSEDLVKVALDGEMFDLPLPLHFEVLPLALQVIRPAKLTSKTT